MRRVRLAGHAASIRNASALTLAAMALVACAVTVFACDPMASAQTTPTSGPPGTSVRVAGSGFNPAGGPVTARLIDGSSSWVLWSGSATNGLIAFGFTVPQTPAAISYLAFSQVVNGQTFQGPRVVFQITAAPPPASTSPPSPVSPPSPSTGPSSRDGVGLVGTSGSAGDTLRGPAVPPAASDGTSAPATPGTAAVVPQPDVTQSPGPRSSGSPAAPVARAVAATKPPGGAGLVRAVPIAATLLIAIVGLAFLGRRQLRHRFTSLGRGNSSDR